MDYSEAREAFFGARSGDVAELGWISPARRLRDAIEPLATVCYWSEPAYDALAAVGLDFLTGYVWGRGSQLGEPSGAVVAAAFGVFEPGMIAAVYDDGRSRCSLADVRAAREAGVTAALTAALGEPTPAATGAADALLDAVAGASPLGRPFFAGLDALDVPTEPWARLWHACSLVREHRGDAHLAACVGAEVDGLEANLLTEAWIGWEPGAYAGSRGWSAEAIGAARRGLVERDLLTAEADLTGAGRALRESLETATDAAEARVVSALDDRADGGLDGLLATLEGWSTRVVDAGWFPPDPYKRAAG